MAFVARIARSRIASSQSLSSFLGPSQQQAAIHRSGIPHQAAVPEPVLEPPQEPLDWKSRLGVVRSDWT